MPIQERCYTFGRLNVLAGHRLTGDPKEKRNLILGSLQHGNIAYYQDFGWGFFDVSEMSYQGEDFAAGYLVRFKPVCEEEVVDDQSHRVTLEALSNRVSGKSSFFLHYRTGILAFHPASGKVSAAQFRQRFAQIFEEANERFMVQAELQLIQEEYGILEAIKQFDCIRRITISLHPSNPSNRHIWERTDERLKAMRAEKYREEYATNSAEGMLVPDEGEVYGDILMAHDGYGKAEIEGVMDGKTSRASTEMTPVQASTPAVDDPETLLGALLSTFEKIWQRFRT